MLKMDDVGTNRFDSFTMESASSFPLKEKSDEVGGKSNDLNKSLTKKDEPQSAW